MSYPIPFRSFVIGCVLNVAMIGFACERSQAQDKPSLEGKIVIANLDKYPVTFRVGELKKEISPRKASVLGPKNYPFEIEVWNGYKQDPKWEKQTIEQAGIYALRFYRGRWVFAKHEPRQTQGVSPGVPRRSANTTRPGPTYRYGTGSRPRVSSRGGGTRVVNNYGRGGWRGTYWSPIARGIWAAGSIYRFIRDEEDRDLFRRLIVDGEIDDAIRREIEDRIWDSIRDDAVNLPVDERAELERAWDELGRINDRDWKDIENLPDSEWDKIRDELGDEVTDADWNDWRDELGDISDTMDITDEDIDTMDEIGLDDLEQDVDIGDLGDADLGDFEALGDNIDFDDFSLDADDLDLGDLGEEFDAGSFDLGDFDGGGWDSFDFGDFDWGGDDWGGGDVGGGGFDDWGGGFDGGGFDDFGGGFDGGGFDGGGFDDFGGGFDDGGFDFDF